MTNKYFYPPTPGIPTEIFDTVYENMYSEGQLPSQMHVGVVPAFPALSAAENSPIPQTHELESCKHLLDLWTKTQARNEPGGMKQAFEERHTRRDLLLQLSFIVLKKKKHFLRDELTFVA